MPVKNCEGFDVMSPSQIRQIGRRFEVGSHTYEHCFLKGVSISEAHYQIAEGKKQLEDILGATVAGFCYPGGKYGPRDAELVQACGFRYARTTMNLCFDSGDKPYEIPTTLQFYPHQRDVYLRNFARSGNWRNRCDGLRLAVQHKHWIDRLYGLFNHAHRYGKSFHLWGHSRDIDQFDAWGELDLFLAYVAARVPGQDRVTNQQLAARYF
jgi:hypothetical protein